MKSGYICMLLCLAALGCASARQNPERSLLGGPPGGGGTGGAPTLSCPGTPPGNPIPGGNLFGNNAINLSCTNGDIYCEGRNNPCGADGTCNFTCNGNTVLFLYNSTNGQVTPADPYTTITEAYIKAGNAVCEYESETSIFVTVKSCNSGAGGTCSYLDISDIKLCMSCPCRSITIVDLPDTPDPICPGETLVLLGHATAKDNCGKVYDVPPDYTINNCSQVTYTYFKSCPDPTINDTRTVNQTRKIPTLTIGANCPFAVNSTCPPVTYSGQTIVSAPTSKWKAFFKNGKPCDTTITVKASQTCTEYGSTTPKPIASQNDTRTVQLCSA